MVVDDAVVVRGLIARWVEAEPDLHVVALAAQRARGDRAGGAQPIRTWSSSTSICPRSTGSPRCRVCSQKKRDLVVLMASTLTRRNAEVSLRALSLGAADYIPKPRDHSRDHQLADIPPRTDRQDPRARRPPQAARRRPAVAAQAAPVVSGAGRASRMRPVRASSPDAPALSERRLARHDSSCGRSRRRRRACS